MKKKILIVNNNTLIGGVQKSLINLLNEIKKEYDITLFVFKKKGDYYEEIPKEVNVIEANKFLQLLGISQKESKQLGKIYYIFRGMLVICTRIFGNHIPYFILMRTENKISNFDYAISYLQSSNERSFYGGCNEFVLKRVNAKEKIAFIHCDFLNYGGNTTYNKKIYHKFDKIVTVSEGCKDKFIKAIPNLEDKVYCVRNFNNYDEIIKQSNNSPIIYDKSYFNIVTVSRLSKEKGIIRSIKIIKNLIECGFNIRWHIVGDGELRNEIVEILIKEKLDKNIILYGNQINPYRYMRNADIFFLPSYHEAAPMVFDEAKCIGVPILATKTTSTKEIIEEPDIGWVCDNNEEQIYIKLESILKDRRELNIKREKLKHMTFNNLTSINQFKKVIGKAENAYGKI